MLMDNQCRFPDYTVDSLYRKEFIVSDKKGNIKKIELVDWQNGLEYYIKKIPSFIPQFFKRNSGGRDKPVAEIICHLGSGTVPTTAPNGLDITYFKGRATELKRLKAVKSFIIKKNINLVDFDYL